MKYSSDDMMFYRNSIYGFIEGTGIDYKRDHTFITHTPECRDENLLFIKKMTEMNPCRIIEAPMTRPADDHVIDKYSEDGHKRSYYIYEFGETFPFSFEFPFKNLELKLIIQKCWAYYNIDTSLGLIKPKLANKINNYKFIGNLGRYSGHEQKLGSVVRIDGFCGGSDVKPRLHFKTKPTFEYPYGLDVVHFKKKTVKELSQMGVIIKHNFIKLNTLYLIDGEPHDWEIIKGISGYHVDSSEALDILFQILKETKSNG